MRQDIHLYLGNSEVEFNEQPQILYNFTETDLRNISSIKDNYSKSISVDGTQNNNRLFGHIWNIEHTAYGAMFDATRKESFTLYINGEIYERGYCKLDSVDRTGNNIVYNITLTGLLGGFFGNLQYKDGDTDAKMTLADLTYRYDGQGPAVNLDFTINKETVWNAWNQLARTRDDLTQFDFINFAFTSEGSPSDGFDADKVLINTVGTDLTKVDGDYKTVLGGALHNSGYALGELKNPATMDNTLDLRSYLLRPVINIKQVIHAICNPENNGGYQVDLDSHFFDASQNPYYKDAWMTLPLLKELGINKTANYDASNISLTNLGNNISRINYTSSAPSSPNARLRFTLTANTTSSANNLYFHKYIETDARYHNREWDIKKYSYDTGIQLCLVAFDSYGNQVGLSPVYILMDENTKSIAKSYIQSINFAVGYRFFGDNPKRKYVYGKFVKKNGVFTFCDGDDNILEFDLRLEKDVEYSELRLYALRPQREEALYTYKWPDTNEEYPLNNNTGSTRLATIRSEVWTGLHTLSEVQTRNSVNATFGFNISSLQLIATSYEGLFSNTFIPADRLLSTSSSPAEILSSYLKMFGLYCYYNPSDEADDPDTCPNGVIHIVDRDTFYTDEYVNIENKIDRSRTMSIDPSMADTKWLSFDLEGIESEAETKYKKTFGYNYGRQLCNTGLNFNRETTELYDGNAFKSGVMVRERNGYFRMPYNYLPAYAYDGVKYNLYKVNGDDYDTVEESIPKIKLSAGETINPYGLYYYDLMPKLQVRQEGNDAGDGAGVLLFYNGTVNANNGTEAFHYCITDDIPDMARLNDGNACWLMTATNSDYNGTRIAYFRNDIPFFTRDLVRGSQEGDIVHSWNFGHPQETFVPNTYSTDYDCIYDKCWRDYTRDMYNRDTVRLTAFVNFDERPSQESLRKWYWFDNAIWRINAIKDCDITSFEPTQVEFIKVQDVNNYKLRKITYSGIIQIILDSYDISYSGGTITGRVVTQSSTNSWSFFDTFTITNYDGTVITGTTSNYLSPVTGSGLSTQITINIPANSGAQRTFRFALEDDSDNSVDVYITQEGDRTPELRFTDTAYTFTFVGGEAELSFYQRNIQTGTLSATSNQNWLSASVTETGVAIAASTYSGMTNRTATVTLTGTGINEATMTTTATITQTSAALSVSPNNLTFDYWDRTGQDVTITTSGPWTATEIE